MTINANIYVLFILLLMIIVGVVAWRLARRKSRHPVLVTFLCMLLCLAPPFALLALLILALWRDLPVRPGAEQPQPPLPQS
ncbi:hypothetical protein [Aeromonas taiwanensis]|uniref:hypothetical protein n=1 Tax=Aeromonas taiwanensis TaxID=633417 RepID=UPI00248E51A1|nr:hypothetical protein [Aeromonas taiwanensis]